jgi:Carboxypeptidase regulatory-like domain
MTGSRLWGLISVGFVAIAFGSNSVSSAQTASTGAVIGVALDPSGAVLEDAPIKLTKADTAEVRSTSSDNEGRFGFLLLPPGAYRIEASKPGLKALVENIRVNVTEIIRIKLNFGLERQQELTQVSSEPNLVQLDTSALGKTINEDSLRGLPLATRNFSQIAGLSPGVAGGVSNAGELGLGGTALSQIGNSNDGIFVHGSRSYDNNWQLDGINVSDTLSTGSASGGIPTPNPDVLEEFKLQTGLYEAAFGRAAGANVTLITKKGSNEYHGSLFEFLRNDILNANDYFLTATRQRRPALKQNQFGFVFGGPILKDKLLFFGSYQGTRQVNGVAAGQARVACSASLYEPPLTNDRSAAALGALFGGLQGALGGVAVNPDGSNINSVALNLLNLKLPNGNFLIPTPQTIDLSSPFATQGFSVFTEPCHFGEDQVLFNLHHLASQKHEFTVHLFFSNSDQSVTFSGTSNAMGNTPGFTSPGSADFFVGSLTHTYLVSNTELNEFRIGFVRTVGKTGANAPFAWSDIGVAESTMNNANELPSLQIMGSLSMASAFPRTYIQNNAVLNDGFSWFKGAHALQFGGSILRMQDPLEFGGFGSFVQFLSWPDFLLGLSGTDNGTEIFSNVFKSSDAFGLLNRKFLGWEFSTYAQDNYRISRRLTVNLGIRYERPGQFADKLGRNGSFDVTKANYNPPQTGSLDGLILASNFLGATPPGVTKVDNKFGTYGEGQNTFAPRIGFALQLLPRTSSLALRGGYGLYYSRPTGQVFTASVLAAPFGLTRTSTGVSNAGATFKAPFAQPFPTPSSFPMFSPYSPTTQSSINVLAPDFRPAMIQQFGLSLQTELQRSWLLEVGYFGARGTHLQRYRSLNQALFASADRPIRGETSNTLSNIGLRVPIPGIRPDSLREMESEGSSWYNGLEASLTKRLIHGFQFLASYTFSKTLDTDGANINGTSAVNTLTLGDQNSPRQRWGRTSFDRSHRFVLSETWTLPNPSGGFQRALLGGWDIAAVLTIQSGTALTISDVNSDNVVGINEDRAQLSGTCSKNQLITSGSTQSKLKGYFNRSCFTTPIIIGADGIGTAFGNSSTGIVDGPGEANVDIAFSKKIIVHQSSAIQFRAEFFNALNHPQFANPDTNFTSPTFGRIISTAVNPRVGQVAVKYTF